MKKKASKKLEIFFIKFQISQRKLSIPKTDPYTQLFVKKIPAKYAGKIQIQENRLKRKCKIPPVVIISPSLPAKLTQNPRIPRITKRNTDLSEAEVRIITEESIIRNKKLTEKERTLEPRSSSAWLVSFRGSAVLGLPYRSLRV